MNALTHKKRIDSGFKKVVFSCTTITLISLFSIIFFILIQAMPLFKEVNIVSFIFGTAWYPLAESPQFGIAGFIVCSLLTTIMAVIIGIPIGLYTAIYIAEIASKKISNFVLFVIEILAAIPSVIYGFFGIKLIAPIIANVFELSIGTTLFTASIILSFMVLPTVVSLSTSALKAVPNSVVEGSLALGATKIQTIFKTKISYAKSGILASFLLGIGRALGETMAVVLVIGNSIAFPNLTNLFATYFSGGRTLTTNIVTELAYSSGTHRAALFATGVVLFVFVSVLNLVIMQVKKKGVK